MNKYQNLKINTYLNIFIIFLLEIGREQDKVRVGGRDGGRGGRGGERERERESELELNLR